MTSATARLPDGLDATARLETNPSSQLVGLNVAVDQMTLDAIDKSAQASGLTRSGFLALTLRKAVAEAKSDHETLDQMAQARALQQGR